MKATVCLVGFFVFALVFPFLLLHGEKQGGESTFASISYLFIVYGAARVFLNVCSRSPSLFIAVYGVFVYMNLGIAPLLQVYTGVFPWPEAYKAADMVRANVAFLVGCIAVECGYLISKRSAVRSGSLIDVLISMPIPIRRLNLACVVGLPVVSALVYLTGWHTAVFVARSDVWEFASSRLNSSTSLIVAGVMMKIIPFMISVALAQVVGGRVKTRKVAVGEESGYWPMPVYLAFGIVYAAITLLIANPISAPRFWFATIVVSYAVIGFMYIEFDPRRWAPVVLLIGYVVVFPVADHFRRSIDSEKLQIFVESGLLVGVRNNIRSADFDGYQQMMNAILVGEERGYRYGLQIAGSVFNFVPRFIWQDKPLQSGMYLAEQRGYFYTNLSCPLWAEGFIDYSWIGVAVYLFGLGWIFAVFDKGVARDWWCSSLSNVFGIMFAGFLVYFLRGALMNVAPYFVIAGLVLFTMCFQTRNIQVNNRFNARHAHKIDV